MGTWRTCWRHHLSTECTYAGTAHLRSNQLQQKELYGFKKKADVTPPSKADLSKTVSDLSQQVNRLSQRSSTQYAVTSPRQLWP